MAKSQYEKFLASKLVRFAPVGFEIKPEQINPLLGGDFQYESDIVRWSLGRGRCALFEDCGLGKSFQQLEWSKFVSIHTGHPVLILAPLAVNLQTQGEGVKLGIPVTLCESSADLQPGVNITNYEKLHHFTPEGIGGIVLDESSILKSFDGKTRKQITEFAQGIHYRLCCTATPAPNDYMELGTHAEFLGAMTQSEMLAMFFVHDGGDTSKWRLKKHAEQEFWKWVCSWAVAIRRPSDLGYSDERFILPPLEIHQVTVESAVQEGALFAVEARTLSERRDARRSSLEDRVRACAELVAAEPDEPWLIWCDLNVESEGLTKAIRDAVEITGSDSPEVKQSRMKAFIVGDVNDLVSKPSICGWGLNLQRCARMAFVGLSDSFEAFYQAVRRCYRFGQTRPVHAYVITSEAEGAVVRNIERKQRDAELMMEGMVKHMKSEMQKQVKGQVRDVAKYKPRIKESERWRIDNGDCVDMVKQIADESIDYSIFSPPFASLYTYSNSERDMGNAKTYDEFAQHFGFLSTELFRVIKPGRLLSFHCMNLPLSKQNDGVIGIRDFRGHLIRIFEDAGFTFHSEVCIWKDPVTAMQRTKAIGLLYKQLRKDSVLSRQGIPDYLVTMRKATGPNAEPVTKTHESFPVDLWQEYASPVWMDIDAGDTLTRREAREQDDERHICALQLGVIDRAIKLWTNPNDLILSPFAGIGSEGYVALQMGRRFHGIELKESYWKQAVKNLGNAETNQQSDLLAEEETNA